MAGPLRTEAIVLRAMKYGEADRILHVFTPELGRRSVIARGARRQKSKLGGRLEPPARVDLELHEGRGDIATVTGATTVAAFLRLRERLDSIEAALHACDDVDRLFGPGEAHPPAYHLLANHLAALDAEASAATPARQLAFRLKLLTAAGLTPQTSACVACGAAGPLVAFSGEEGGLLCEACRARGFPVAAGFAGWLGGALAAPLAAAPDAEALVLRQVDRALTELAREGLGARLRGLQIG